MPKRKKIIIGTAVALFALTLFAFYSQKRLVSIYNERNSVIITDRNREEIAIKPNKDGYYSRYIDKIPDRLKELLVRKEDRYFYYHPGFNPVSIIKAVFGRLGFANRLASSTISQQLVKILLKQENERNLRNKIMEFFYAVSLELFQSKESILKMYANSAYFGNQAQGIKEASRLYFNLPPELLDDGKIIQLLSAIHNPTDNNPLSASNAENSKILAENLGVSENVGLLSAALVKANAENYNRFDSSYFELKNFAAYFNKDEQLTIDKEMTAKIRGVIQQKIIGLADKNVKNAAAVVVKLPENQILSLVGSPDPASDAEGYKICMLEKTRPIGSTIKPFIYAKAFEKNLRPYTLVNDQEYKYVTALGFPLYPKNFDYKYRGITSLHYALSNSLNVPAVKALEYVGLDNFYSFLEKDLEFKPVQDLDNYQLGIALGSLEMSLIDLAKYFTIFPNMGELKNLKISIADNSQASKKIVSPEYVQLVNKILSDRKTGAEQFGFKSNLNLFQNNYALKTGTSRDFKDSLVVGYTPDFLVAVWVGNADNSSMDEVSGQTGAGAIWSKIMEMMLNSNYNKKTPFDFSMLKNFKNPESGTIEYGLNGDNYDKNLSLLIGVDDNLILNPHDGDVFIQENNSQIILKAKEAVKWYADGKFIAESDSASFLPEKSGQIKINAITGEGKTESVNIFINQ